MSGLARSRRRFLKPLAIWLGGFLLVVGLVITGWLLWSIFRPPPDGFGPTVGEAKGAIDGSANVLQYTIDARSREDWAYFDADETLEGWTDTGHLQSSENGWIEVTLP